MRALSPRAQLSENSDSNPWRTVGKGLLHSLLRGWKEGMNEIPVFSCILVHVGIMHCCLQLNIDLKFVMFVGSFFLLCLILFFHVSLSSFLKKTNKPKHTKLTTL